METGQINLFDNLGFTLVKLSDLEVAPIKSEISKIESNFSSAHKFNDNLAGNIKKEFLLRDSKDHIANLLQPLVSNYNRLNKNWVSKIAAETPYRYPEKGLVLREAWVNFQKNMNLILRIIIRGS
jgi:hypothetical protein